MVSETLTSAVLRYVETHGAMGTGCPTGVEGLYAIANTETTACSAAFYEPIMCLVLQGAKEAYMSDRVVRYGAGDVLIVSHAVPVEAAVIKASANAPYGALALRLDLALVRSLHDEIGDIPETQEAPLSVNAAASDDTLVDAMSRLFALSQDRIEAHTLAPLVPTEIHSRLLRARHGGMWRRLLQQDSSASRISKTIAIICENYKSTIAVAELASECGMSLSAFHEHFKSVTATTPLQYQKELRLLEARRLLSTSDLSVAAAAYEVGYESPTQFSREFSRKFGVSPSTQKTKGKAAVG